MLAQIGAGSLVWQH